MSGIGRYGWLLPFRYLPESSLPSRFSRIVESSLPRLQAHAHGPLKQSLTSGGAMRLAPAQATQYGTRVSNRAYKAQNQLLGDASRGDEMHEAERFKQAGPITQIGRRGMPDRCPRRTPETHLCARVPGAANPIGPYRRIASRLLRAHTYRRRKGSFQSDPPDSTTGPLIAGVLPVAASTSGSIAGAVLQIRDLSARPTRRALAIPCLSAAPPKDTPNPEYCLSSTNTST